MTATPPRPAQLHCSSIGSGPELVVLHGLFGDGDNWRGIAKRLSASYRVHLMDLINHGQSPHRDHMDYPSMAADVVHTCQQLGLSQWHLLGHSMGGKTAMRASLDHPQRINKLIIVDIAPRRYPPRHGDIIQGLKLLANSAPANRQAADRIIADLIPDAGIRSFLLKNLRRDTNGHLNLVLNLEAISCAYSSITDEITANNSFTHSTLFIKGANSDYLADSDRDAILALFPAAKSKIVGGAGHWPHAEKPAVMEKLITDFLHDD